MKVNVEPILKFEVGEEEFKKCLFILSLTDKQYNKIKKKYKVGELELL